MSGSVAGKIRIDLLANAANFNAGLAEGRRGMQDFQSTYERFNRSFESAKQRQARADTGKDAWRSATSDVYHSLPSSRKTTQRFLEFGALGVGDIKPDQALRNDVRWKSMLPWGHSFRYTLSREAAETAAAIGDAKQTVVKRLASAASEIGQGAAGAAGLGGLLGGIRRFAANHPLVTAGAIGTGWAIKEIQEDNARARAARETANLTGAGIRDASLMNAIGLDGTVGMKFIRSMASRSEGFGKLGLDAEKLGAMPMKDALMQVADAFGRVGNHADKADIAFEIFGRGAEEMIPTLSALREKLDAVSEFELVTPKDAENVRAFDRSLNGLKNGVEGVGDAITGALGLEAGFGTTLLQGFEQISYLIRGDMEGYNKAARRQLDDAARIENADELDKARQKTEQMAADTKKMQEESQRFADNMRKAADTMAESNFSQWVNARFGKNFSDDKEYLDKAIAGGMSPDLAYANLRLLQRRREETEQLGRANSMAESSMSPQARFARDMQDIGQWRQVNWWKEGTAQRMEEAARNELHAGELRDLREKASPSQSGRERIEFAMAEADLWRKHHAERKDAEEVAWRLRLNAMRQYYQEQAGLDLKHLETAARGTEWMFRRRSGFLDHAEVNGWIGKEGAAEGRFQNRKSMLGEFGLTDWTGEYEHDFANLAKSRDSLTPEQFELARRKLRERAIGGVLSEMQETAPVGAASQGSAEAYQTIAQAQLNDPKLTVARETLQVLERIENKIQAQPVRPQVNPMKDIFE
jgi:hypothetical protein